MPRSPLSLIALLSLIAVAGFAMTFENAVTAPLILSIEGTETTFFDVPDTAWFAKPVEQMILSGISTGYRNEWGRLTGFYKPENPVTYAEVAKIVFTLKGGIDPELITEPPNNISARNTWASPYIRLAEEAGLTVFGEGLNVHTPASRGAVIQTIVDVLDLPAVDSFSPIYSDLPETHSYALAILAATQSRLVSGESNGVTRIRTVRPDAYINRAELAKVLSPLVPKTFVAQRSAGSSSSRPAYQTTVYRITSPALNIRALADVQSRIVGGIQFDDVVIITTESGIWAKIKLESGLEGYVIRSFLEPINPEQSLPSISPAQSSSSSVSVSSPAYVSSESSASSESSVSSSSSSFSTPTDAWPPNTTIYRITSPALNVRSVPDPAGRIIGGVHPQDTVIILSEIGDWAQIRMEDGLEGYVIKKWLRVVE